MPKTGKTRYALLGILNMKPMSGYDLKKFCDEAVSQFWNENYAHIYPQLRGLEREGLATAETAQTEGRPVKRIYHITEKGKKELNDWLRQPVEPSLPRYELLLKLVFSTEIPLQNIREKIEQYKKENEQALEKVIEGEYEVRQQSGAKGEKWMQLWLIGINNGKHGYKAAIDWCDETLQILKGMQEKGEA
jgi:PadR family transcriptional regulator, regulatory protein AphA